MATTETPYRVLSLPQELREADGDKAFVALGRALGVGAFGVGAGFQRKAGGTVIPDHHEAGQDILGLSQWGHGWWICARLSY